MAKILSFDSAAHYRKYTSKSLEDELTFWGAAMERSTRPQRCTIVEREMEAIRKVLSERINKKGKGNE